MRTPRSLAEADRLMLIPSWHRAEANEILANLDDAWKRHRPPAGYDHSWTNNTDPGWDNVIRALEEDR